MPLPLYGHIFATFAFLLGAVVGSFLNVCIYRMPIGLSVNKPRRSFCPQCKWQIPWYHNIPLFSWLALRGRCANCGGLISMRYFCVELLTALLFLAVWLHLAWPVMLGPLALLALPYWILTGLFIVATFIDFDHFIIPDEITIGGTVAGLAWSCALPQMMGVETHLASLLWSGIGATTGFLLLWGVVIAGKMAFGRKRIVFEKPAPFTWKREGDAATLTTDGDTDSWMEYFPDEKAVMRMKCAVLEIGGERHEEIEITSHYLTLTVAGRDYDLNQIETFSGEFREVFFERDAMGFGDVKFIACIGAFLGWKAVLFSVMSASVLGSVIGVTAIVLRRREWSAKIPFGPYLAAGAMIWMFYGPQLVEWYWDFVHPPVL